MLDWHRFSSTVMKSPILALALLGSSLLGAALAVGVLFAIEPWDDESTLDSTGNKALSATEARIIASDWIRDHVADRVTECEVVEETDELTYATCYAYYANGRVNLETTVGIPNDSSAPHVLECKPIDRCERRGLMPNKE